MKKTIDLSDILLNYKQITISTSLMENFCLKEEPNLRNHSLSYMETVNQLTIQFHLSIYSLFYMKNQIFSKIHIQPSGIYFCIDFYINQILSKYNLNLSQKDIQERVEAIKEIIKKSKKKEELKKVSIQLYKEYLELEKRYQEDRKEYKDPLKIFIHQQLETLEYISTNLENQFMDISCANSNLEWIDFDKLKLIIAYQIMEQSKKTKQASTIIYLKEYLRRNQHLLDSNYEIKKKITDPFGVTSIQCYSIQEIYDYLNSFVTKKKTSEPLSIPNEQYDYSFLSSSSNDPQEILTKYYKLGMNSKNPEQLKVLLRRKITYYKTLDIQSIKIGVNTFNGYLGLTLENGTIILDKFYDDIDQGKIAQDEAIYITNEKEFEQVTRLSKKECIEEIKKGKIKAKRMYHTGFWEQRLNNMK